MAGEVTRQVMDNPELYAGVLIDLVQKLGFAATIALFLVIFLMAGACYLLYKLIAGYQFAINTLNEQNKRYQDYFLENRKSSGKKYLSEQEQVQ